MQTVSWLAFLPTGTLTRAVVHFFPFSSNVSAPYVTECRLTIFGAGLPTRAVTLEGARLGQPDGLRLEDAFPETATVLDGRLVGLQIDLEGVQQRMDLSASGCVIEISRSTPGGGGAVRFRPVLLDHPGRSRTPLAPLIAEQDRFQTTSLVVINRSGNPFVPLLGVRPSSARPWEGELVQASLAAPTVAADSIEEISFDGTVWDDGVRQECSWGESVTRAVQLGEPPRGVAYFAVYREPESRRAVSVSAL
jgi:hypothetical protein